MKALRVILLSLLVLFIAYLIWMLFLPGDYRIQRSIGVQAQPGQAFRSLSDFRQWQTWNPWQEVDTTVQITYDSTTTGPGGQMYFQGESIEGAQQILSVQTPDTLTTRISIEGMPPATSQWTTSTTDTGSTRIQWEMHGKLSFFNRVLGLFLESHLGQPYTRALEKLAQKLDHSSGGYVIQRSRKKSQVSFSIRDTLAFEALTRDHIADQFEALADYLGEDFAAIKSPPRIRYHRWDTAQGQAIVEYLLPVNSDRPGNSRLHKDSTLSGPVIETKHYGDYARTGRAHYALEKYLEARELQARGPAVEIFVTDPSSRSNPDQWLTRVFIPYEN